MFGNSSTMKRIIILIILLASALIAQSNKPLDLTLFLTNDYIVLGTHGSLLPNWYFKEVWTFKCKDGSFTTYSRKDVEDGKKLKCVNEKRGQYNNLVDVDFWTLVKNNSDESGSMVWAVHEKGGRPYVDGKNYFVSAVGNKLPDMNPPKNLQIPPSGSIVGFPSPDSIQLMKTAKKLGSLSESEIKPLSLFQVLLKDLYLIHETYKKSSDVDKVMFVLRSDFADNKIRANIIFSKLREIFNQTGFMDIGVSVFDGSEMSEYLKTSKKRPTKDIDKVLKDVVGLDMSKSSYKKRSREDQCDSCRGREDGLSGLFGGDGEAKGIVTKPTGMVDVLYEKLVSEGSLDVSAVLKVVRQRASGLRHAYNKFLKQKPGLHGNVSLKFIVAADGKISDIIVASSTTGSSEFDDEIKHAVKRWNFAKTDFGETTVTTEFVFYEN